MSKVSILMNAYNSERYLKEAIDSIYAQTFTDWEIIFIDNCSVDNTKKIIDTYDKKIKYYKTENNMPLGKARNIGLSKCYGEYLAFLDTDDIWLIHKLEKQINLMDKNKKFKMCYSGVIYINENSKEIGRFLPQAKSGNVFSQQLKRYEINMQTVIIRNDININFNEKMQFAPDFNLFMKVSSKYSVCVLAEHMAKYRKLKNSLTIKKIDRWWIETKETLDDIFNNNINLKKRYIKESKLAYAKVYYYKARYLISIGEKTQARRLISSIKKIDIRYYILYIILFFPKSFWNWVHNVKNQ